MHSHDPKVLAFYKTKAWRNVRNYVFMKSRGVCNRCGKAGTEVHHKIPLTAKNVDDPNIALNPDNLELLCTACHNTERGQETYVRNDLLFTKDGEIIKK